MSQLAVTKATLCLGIIEPKSLSNSLCQDLLSSLQFKQLWVNYITVNSPVRPGYGRDVLKEKDCIMTGFPLIMTSNPSDLEQMVNKAAIEAARMEAKAIDFY